MEKSSVLITENYCSCIYTATHVIIVCDSTREPIYRVGDTVRIVDRPYGGCPFSWVGAMNHYCGYYATIEEVLLELEWGETNAEGYRIDTDNGEFVWCANCFEPVGTDIEESDSDMSVLLVK